MSKRRLTDVGKAAYDAAGGGHEGLIEAFAAMLTEPKSSRRAVAGRTLPFTPQQVYTALRDVEEHLALGAYTHTDFARLGATMHSMPDLVVEDLPRLVAWIADGGVARWPAKPGFAHIVRNFPKLVAWAREWERRGGKHTMGGYDEAFKR